MAYEVFATYAVYFDNQAELDYALSFVPLNPDGSYGTLKLAPADAAPMFGLTWPVIGGPKPPKGYIFFSPYTPGSEIQHPGPSGILMDGAVLTKTVPGQVTAGGTGQAMDITWAVAFIFRGPDYSGGDVTLIAPIPPRRWFYGAEGNNQMECHPQSGTGNRARDASRVVDGFGIKLRDEVAATVMECVLANSDGPDLPSRQSWERLYVRIQNTGAITGKIWRATGTVSTLSGAALQINTDRTISVKNIDGGGIETVLATIPALSLNTWYRVDILVQFATGLLNGRIRVYLNGVISTDSTVGTGSVGLGQIQNHRSSLILSDFNSSNSWEIDIDDWHNAEIPNVSGIETLNSLDWLVGTHVRPAFTVSLSPGSFAGPSPFILDQFLQPAASGGSYVSTTVSDSLQALTDGIDIPDDGDIGPLGLVLGPAAAVGCVSGNSAGGAPNNGTVSIVTALGTGTKGPAGLVTGFAVTASLFPAHLLLSLTPYILAPFSVGYQKGASAAQTNITSMTVFIQYIGVFGPEDAMQGDPNGYTFNKLMHNCRYPEVAWAIPGPTPDAPCCVTAGTYVGNNTAQDITLPLPGHLIIIRNITTGGIPPLILTSAMFGPQQGGTSQDLAGDIVRTFIDPITGFCNMRVTGNSTRINAAANTYQYVVFEDPGLRYSINDEINHGNSSSTFANALIDGLFLPQFGILLTGPTTGGTGMFKGPSHTGFEASTFNGGLLSNAMSFDTGILRTQQGATSSIDCSAYSLYRTNDGSGVVMIQITNYVGDGTASRVIPLTPVSSRFPLAVIVVRRGTTAAVYRDPSHAGVNSIILNTGGNTNNSIIGGGVDSITVGTGLNANGGLYDVFCIPGSGSSWGVQGTFCGPNGLAPGDFWEDPPVEPSGVGAFGEGGLTLGETNSLTLLKDVSGIYTLTPGTHSDTLIDRQTGQPSVEMEIPDPTFKTGYIGG